MYSVNMIDLQSSEYNELKLLVETERAGKDPVQLANSRLHPTGEKYAFDRRMCEIYSGLASVKLISGFNVDNGFLFHEINQRGFDFIDDYAASEKAETKRTKEQRAHDYKVALFGIVSGGLLGFLGGLLSGPILTLVEQLTQTTGL